MHCRAHLWSTEILHNLQKEVQINDQKQGSGFGHTIMPWLGRYSLIRTWLSADGNSPDSSYIFCVRFVNHGGTARERVRIDMLAEHMKNNTKQQKQKLIAGDQPY